ncbi:DNA-binding MarR family transcriptional regulator [Lactobacillus colini]|uniref:DNA-binding MarR family transcriptional regulator n=1 Tax=Lactobacillus colini TaxID=1819254 RepID=A0ABS4MFB2_9LACO|nr:MarR family transcriptional regulator [Lactobacillus colini]MBP2058052.1 DNA-binding MarR family transcriptional regulator [Lactobacillus colini]
MSEDILRQIGTIARALDSIANIEFKKINLNRGQYLYLVRIMEYPGLFSDQLANLLNVDRTTAARSIQKLEKQGLVHKEADEKNKKIKRLFVTDKGLHLAEVIERENAYSNKNALAGLSEDEQKSLQEMLAKVERNTSRSWNFVKNGGRRGY